MQTKFSAKVRFQNNGSRWLILLNGTKSQIEETFNSFWNLRATSGELDWNGDEAASFWSSPERIGTGKDSMFDYFYNFHVLHTVTDEMDAEIRAKAEKFVQKSGKGLTNEIYRREVGALRKRLTEELVVPMAKKDFDDFKANNATDWNQSFQTRTPNYHTYRFLFNQALKSEGVENEESDILVES